LNNQKYIFETVIIILNITFVELIFDIQRFCIGTTQLFFYSFTILSRNDSFSYAVFIGSIVNESYCICREIIDYYFNQRIPFLKGNLRNGIKKLFFWDFVLWDVVNILKIVWNFGGTWNLCFQDGKFYMEF